MIAIKTTALLLSTLALCAAPLAACAGAGPVVADPTSPVVAAPSAGASLSLTFDGIKTPTGQILAALFDSEAAYTGKSGTPRGLALPVTAASATTTVEGLAPGRYAIRAFHDIDGDGKLATNPFGLPTEPFAFSNNAKGAMGPAAWRDAQFEVGAGGAVQIIAID